VSETLVLNRSIRWAARPVRIDTIQLNAPDAALAAASRSWSEREAEDACSPASRQ